MMRAVFVSSLLVLAACDRESPAPGEDFRVCAGMTVQPTFFADLAPNDSVVEVDVDVRDDTATFVFGEAEVEAETFDGSWTFALQGHTIAPPTPPVRVFVAPLYHGEGSGSGFVRFVDAVGLWFEGGLRASSSTVYFGGHFDDGAFGVGSVAKECAADADEDDEDDGGTVYDVAVAFDDGVVDVAGGESATGTFHGVEVAAIAGHATRVKWHAETAVDDAYGEGDQSTTEVKGLLFRTAP